MPVARKTGGLGAKRAPAKAHSGAFSTANEHPQDTNEPNITFSNVSPAASASASSHPHLPDGTATTRTVKDPPSGSTTLATTSTSDWTAALDFADQRESTFGGKIQDKTRTASFRKASLAYNYAGKHSDLLSKEEKPRPRMSLTSGEKTSLGRDRAEALSAAQRVIAAAKAARENAAKTRDLLKSSSIKSTTQSKEINDSNSEAKTTTEIQGFKSSQQVSSKVQELLARMEERKMKALQTGRVSKPQAETTGHDNNNHNVNNSTTRVSSQDRMSIELHETDSKHLIDQANYRKDDVSTWFQKPRTEQGELKSRQDNEGGNIDKSAHPQHFLRDHESEILYDDQNLMQTPTMVQEQVQVELTPGSEYSEMMISNQLKDDVNVEKESHIEHETNGYSYDAQDEGWSIRKSNHSPEHQQLNSHNELPATEEEANGWDIEEKTIENQGLNERIDELETADSFFRDVQPENYDHDLGTELIFPEENLSFMQGAATGTNAEDYNTQHDGTEENYESTYVDKLGSSDQGAATVDQVQDTQIYQRITFEPEEKLAGNIDGWDIDGNEFDENHVADQAARENLSDFLEDEQTVESDNLQNNDLTDYNNYDQGQNYTIYQKSADEIALESKVQHDKRPGDVSYSHEERADNFYSEHIPPADDNFPDNIAINDHTNKNYINENHGQRYNESYKHTGDENEPINITYDNENQPHPSDTGYEYNYFDYNATNYDAPMQYDGQGLQYEVQDPAQKIQASGSYEESVQCFNGRPAFQDAGNSAYSSPQNDNDLNYDYEPQYKNQKSFDSYCGTSPVTDESQIQCQVNSISDRFNQDKSMKLEPGKLPPHPRMSFGFNGDVVVYAPRRKPNLNVLQSQQNENLPQAEILVGRVRIYNFSDIASNTEDEDFISCVNCFDPYPSKPTEQYYHALNQYAEKMAFACKNLSSAALWSVLGGMVIGEKNLAQALHAHSRSDTKYELTECPIYGKEARLEKICSIEDLVSSGKMKAAVTAALKSGFFDLALILSSTIDRKTYLMVLNSYAERGLPKNSALQTMVLSIVEKNKDLFVKSKPLDLKNWMRVAGALYSGGTGGKSNHINSLLSLSSALMREKKDYCAAHTCVLLAGVSLSHEVGADRNDSKCVLLGADHQSFQGRRVQLGSPSSVIKSILFEASELHKNSKEPIQYVIQWPLLPYKVSLILNLCFVGRLDLAAKYCDMVSNFLRTALSGSLRGSVKLPAFTQSFINTLHELEFRIRGWQSSRGEDKSKTVPKMQSIARLFSKGSVDDKSTNRDTYYVAPKEKRGWDSPIASAVQAIAPEDSAPNSISSETTGSHPNMLTDPSGPPPASLPPTLFHPKMVVDAGSQPFLSTSSTDGMSNYPGHEQSAAARHDPGQEYLNVLRTGHQVAPPGQDNFPSMIPHQAGQPEQGGFSEVTSNAPTEGLKVGQLGQDSHRKATQNVLEEDGPNDVQEAVDNRTESSNLEETTTRHSSGLLSWFKKPQETQTKTNKAEMIKSEGTKQLSDGNNSKKSNPSNQAVPKKTWGSILTEKLQAIKGGPPKAKPFEQNKFYFNKELGRWVVEGEEDEAAKDAGPPPPPKASEMRTASTTQPNTPQDISVNNQNNMTPSTIRPESKAAKTNVRNAGRTGARSRYVDTLNKVAPQSAPRSTLVPPLLAPPGGINMFVPLPPIEMDNNVQSNDPGTTPSDGEIQLEASHLNVSGEYETSSSPGQTVPDQQTEPAPGPLEVTPSPLEAAHPLTPSQTKNQASSIPPPRSRVGAKPKDEMSSSTASAGPVKQSKAAPPPMVSQIKNQASAIPPPRSRFGAKAKGPTASKYVSTFATNQSPNTAQPMQMPAPPSFNQNLSG